LGRSLGKSLSEFKRASNELKNTLEEEIRVDERRADAERRRALEAERRKADESAAASSGDAAPMPIPRETPPTA
jgi:Sec-independent protein translocase protein TatA